MEQPEAETTSLSKLFKNSALSLVTLVLPLVVSVITIPYLIEGLGKEKFGILSLAWIFIGYFTLFDLGLGRAITKFVAEYIAQDRAGDLPELVWTSWFAIGFLGLTAAAILLIVSPLVINMLQIPENLTAETRLTLVWIAFSIPFVMAAAGIRAVLEACHQFKAILFVTTPASAMNFILPVIVLVFFTDKLYWIVGTLFINRIITAVLLFVVCIKVTPITFKAQKPRLALLKPLFQFGGWLTVSNIIGPVMSYLDRFLVGLYFPLAMVAYYITPSEILQRIRVIPQSFMVVLFPTFSQLNAADAGKSAEMFHRSTRLLFLIMLPLSMLLIVFARDILHVWIDADFALNGTVVLQVLALGMLINSTAQVPYNWIQSAGYANVTAVFHIIELPIYLLFIWLLVPPLGIAGLAAAWVGRSLLDTILLLVFAYWLLDREQRIYRHILSLIMLGVGFMLFANLIVQLESWLQKTIFTILAYILYFVIVWLFYLQKEEKSGLILSFLNILSKPQEASQKPGA